MLSQSGTELKRSQYRLLGLVGQGQFGRVYCAAHRKTGRLVALKNLEQERFSTHKFLRELRFLLTLQHENIVTCRALEHTPTGRYLVMDYCAGGTLRNLMVEDIHLRMDQRLRLVADILAGLAHAHSKGIVHCDIKPENILLDVQPDGWIARISDFGVARLSQELSAHFSGNTGSPAYMAPERFYGQYSTASDIYAVGVLLFELLAGHRPFSGTPGELMNAHLNSPVVVPDGLPAGCQSIIQTALQKLPARRYRSAQDMRDALLPLIEREDEKRQQSGSLPLLYSSQMLPMSDFRCQYQRSLPSPALLLTSYHPASSTLPLPAAGSYPGDRLGYVIGHQIDEAKNPAALAQERTKPELAIASQPWMSHVSPQPVINLWLQSHGCIAMSHRGLYGWLTDDFAAEPTVLAEVDRPFLAAVDPEGRWMAIATLPSALTEGQLWFHSLATLALTRSTPVVLGTAPMSLPKAGQSYIPSQILALDSRHVALISRMIPKTVPLANGKGSRERNGTLLEVFTRRGDRVGSMLLPILTRPMATTVKPYQLIAIDEQHPDCLLVVDLKPYRIARYGLGIQAVYVAATRWGFVAASRSGVIVFINSYGEPLGRIQAPDPITALTISDDHLLWVATWQGDRGSLYQVNVKELELDILF